ncbi:MAG: replication protein RepA [Bryobacteraceae bacterium]
MKSARELVEQLQISELISERSAQVSEIRNRRRVADQDVAFGARPFILCGLPIRRLPAGTLTYRRQNGRFCLDVIGHPDSGVPFGQDRLLILFLATQAVRHQTREGRFRSGAELLLEWGMPTNGDHYKRLVEAFRRVFGSTIFFGTSDDKSKAEVWHCSRTHFFDSMKLWLSESGEKLTGRDNTVTLSHAFWQELQDHPIPIDADVVRLLARNPGCLDLYTWLTWRCHQAKGPERVPLFGSYGLANQLGVQSYSRERKFRERINDWLKLVRLYWPECPAAISSNGAFLEVDRACAILPRAAQASYRQARAIANA